MPITEIVPNADVSIRDSELSLLAWIVVQPINGRTDWYTIAAFEGAPAARQYVRLLHAEEPDREFDYEIREVGTRHHEVIA